MKHCTDEELILHYYGESNGAHADKHFAACVECAGRFRQLSSMLQAVVVADPPERDERYGMAVWQRIRHRLPERDSSWTAWLQWKPIAVVMAASLLLGIGFFAGRVWPVQSGGVAPQAVVAPAADAPSEARRVLFLSVADHLERSDRLLTDVVNADDGYDISQQQEWAEDLLSTSRLYRQDALDADERAIAAVLDETERALLEIVHGPARVSAAQLEDIRMRVDSAALLFKVRVMSDELRREERLRPRGNAREGGRSS